MKPPWYIRQTEFDGAWAVTHGTPEVFIAILDTGLDLAPRRSGWSPRHPAFQPYWRFRLGRNHVHPLSVPLDASGHGTGVAGVLAAGPYALAPACSFLVVKVEAARIPDPERLWAQGLVECVEFAATRGKRVVVNMSLGGRATAEMTEAVRLAADTDVPIVAVAHNDGRDETRYPARLSLENPNVICVGAVDRSGDRARDRRTGRASNLGSSVTILAPGVGIRTTGLGGTWRRYSGTSVAAPFVAAALSLMWSVNPALGTAALREHLVASADRVQRTKAQVPLHPRLNARRAVEAAAACSPSRRRAAVAWTPAAFSPNIRQPAV